MFYKRLIINNFRGIKNADLEFGKLNFLVGKSDSTKSTILKAIQLVTTPNPQPIICINDFYKNDTNNEINIEAYIEDFPNEFLSEEKYGLYLLEEYTKTPTLKICFHVNSDFEVSINVKKEGLEDKPFNFKHRKQISSILIESNYDKNFFYGKYSILNNLMDLSNIQQDLKKIINEQDFLIDNDNFKEISNSISNTSKKYSVFGLDNIETKLDKSLISTSTSSLGLFVNNVLLSMKGISDKKILSIGLALEQNKNNNPILIDEIENSLEPYKIRFMTKRLYYYSNTQNVQIFVTTHSPFCVGQAEIENIKIVRNNDGLTYLTNIPETLRGFVYDKAAEAIFSKKIIAVEGSTELGYINALNERLMNNDASLAYYGTSVVKFDGDRIIQNAINLLELGFPVLLMVDNDVPSQREKINEFVSKNGKLITYKDGYDLEMACFYDLTIDQMDECFKNLNDYDEFCEKVNSIFSCNNKSIIDIYHLNTDNFINKICTSKAIRKVFKSSLFGKILYNEINKLKNGYMIQKNNEIIEWIKQ